MRPFFLPYFLCHLSLLCLAVPAAPPVLLLSVFLSLFLFHYPQPSPLLHLLPLLILLSLHVGFLLLRPLLSPTFLDLLLLLLRGFLQWELASCPLVPLCPAALSLKCPRAPSAGHLIFSTTPRRSGHQVPFCTCMRYIPRACASF